MALRSAHGERPHAAVSTCGPDTTCFAVFHATSSCGHIQILTSPRSSGTTQVLDPDRNAGQKLHARAG
jgi:hypothetical protein